MSVLHYLSSNPEKRAQFIFGIIAPLYRRLDFSTSSHYLKAITSVNNTISIANKSVLDIGTGTGDWGAMFSHFGATHIHGVDFTEKMIQKAISKHPNMDFSIGNAEYLTDFKDNSFDIVTASFVVHGVEQNRRAKMLSEMQRISKSYVVLHDFIGKTPLFLKFLEFMERSDYKHFKKNITNELKALFPSVSSVRIKEGTGVYICKKH